MQAFQKFLMLMLLLALPVQNLCAEASNTTSKFPAQAIELLVRTSKFTDAKKVINLNRKTDPYLAQVWYAITDAYCCDALEEAAEQLKPCLPLHDVNSWVKVKAAHCFNEAQEFETALKILDTVPQTDRESSFYGMRSVSYTGAKKFDQAVRDCVQRAQLETSNKGRFLADGAAIYMRENRYNEALKLLDRAVTSPRVDPNYLILRGHCLAKLGRSEAAIADFTSVIDDLGRRNADRDVSIAVRSRAYRERAACYEQTGKMALAKADNKRAIELSSRLSDEFAGKRGAP